MFDGLDDAYPLSPLQAGILYETLRHPDSDLYIAYILIDINPALSPHVLYNAWHRTARQFSVLRTRFVWEELDEPLQLVNTDVELNWTHRPHLPDKPAAGGLSDDAIVQHWLQSERHKPLPLSDSPPMRHTLIELADNRQVLIWTIHHLLADDWSTPLVLKQVAQHCAADTNATAGISDTCQHDKHITRPFNYGDYVAWLAETAQERHLHWWQSYLGDALATPLQLETVNRETTGQDNLEHHRIYRRLDTTENEAVMQRLQSTGCTLSSVMHAAWAVVLTRYAGTSSALFGTSSSGRSCPLPGITEAVGLFLNTLPTNIRINVSESVDDYVQRVQSQLFDQLAHEHVSLAQLAGVTGRHGDNNLFDTVLVVEAHGNDLQIDIPGSGTAFSNIRYITDSHFPLTVLVFPGQTLSLQVIGAPERFCPATLQMICDELTAVIANLCSAFVSDMHTVLSLQEQRMQALYINDTGPWQLDNTTLPCQRIDQWILQTAKEHAHQIAVIDNGKPYSYQALFDRAQALSHGMESLDVHSDYVGVCVDRSFDLLVTILGVLLSGKAYVPLAGDWPQKRIRQIAADAGLDLILCDQSLPATLAIDGCRLMSLTDALTTSEANDAFTARVCQGNADDAAYMLYTSGSTGQPKGVSISHRNLIYSTRARRQWYQGIPQRYLLLSPAFFDSSVAGIFWTLCSGGTLVLPGPAQQLDVHELEQQIDTHQVTHTLCLSSLYALLLRFGNAHRLRSLRCVIVAGEPCGTALLAEHNQALPHTDLFNEYGPTEATVWATVAKLENTHANAARPVPIGKAIPGTEVRVVNALGDTCPPGVSGELLITGAGVAAGYHADSALTAKRFTDRTYHSGDIAVLGTDQQLYYLGRSDQQLKVRGQRIEAAEVESRLLSDNRAAEAYCCLAGEGSQVSPTSGPTRLVCFYTLCNATESVDEPCHLLDSNDFSATRAAIEQAARERISTELPEHFGVSAFHALNRIPRLPNGKIDPATLPSLTGDDASQQADEKDRVTVLNQQGTTGKICKILSELLGVDEVRPQDNYFALGGDSLTAIRYVALCREQGIDLSIPMISTHNSLAELGQAVDGLHGNKALAIESSGVGSLPLTPIQRWFLSINQPVPAHWNMAFTIELPDSVTIDAMQQAVLGTLEEFPVLGSRFDRAHDKHHAYIDAQTDFFASIDCFDGGEQSLTERLLQMQTGFSLEAGQLIRCSLETHRDGLCRRFGFVIHHLVTDALSNQQLARRIVERLHQSDLSENNWQATSYRQWAINLQAHLQALPHADAGDNKIDSTDTPAGSAVSTDISTWLEGQTAEFNLSFDTNTSMVIQQRAKQAGAESAELLLLLILQCLQQPQSIRVDVETHGRYSSVPLDISASIGWFTSFFTLHCSARTLQDIDAFSQYFHTQKHSATSQFLQQPEHFFNATKQSDTKNGIPALLYNYLATGRASNSTSAQLPKQNHAQGHVFTPVIDSRLRDPQSHRSHAVEIIVMDDAKDGQRILWRIDETLPHTLDVEGWTERVGRALQSLTAEHLPATESLVSEEFPDSGMSDAELDDFLSSLS
ncbi:MAG: amino acid adenylation domain-containing protein [Granulosicoccus sp.]